jgi:hypothetical protein
VRHRDRHRSWTAHINTAYLAWAEDFRLVWISEPASGHSVNLRKNRSAAVAVFDSHQAWGHPDRGLQVLARPEK